MGIKWATWFGAAQNQCEEGAAVCETERNSEGQVHYALMSDEEKMQYDCDKEFANGTVSDACIDYMPEDSFLNYRIYDRYDLLVHGIIKIIFLDLWTKKEKK